ncbi:MAG: 2Fe-2S iron-sulfur cluster-binding protein [Primorskyibacter sp.]
MVISSIADGLVRSIESVGDTISEALFEPVIRLGVTGLARSGKTLTVAADETLSDVLVAHGVAVDIKCSDGICGVCKCGLIEGAVEHRDFVLSNGQRETEIITCQSRAAQKDGKIVIDL